MTHRTPTRGFAAAAALLAALVLAFGCGKNTGKSAPHDQAAKKPAKVTYTPPRALDRELNDIEMDTLRSIKERYKVTRDEYWDGYGGVLANQFIEVWYPQGKVNALGGAGVLEQMEDARKNVASMYGKAPEAHLVVVCSGDLDVFRAATGRDWWNYSLIKGDTISLQAPIDLHTRGLFPMAAIHEYHRWVIGKLSNGRAPLWVEDGLASVFSKEAPILEDQTTEYRKKEPLKMPTDDMERALDREEDRIETRRAYYNAYRMAERMVLDHGRPAVLAFVLACGEEKSLDDAAQRIFHMDYDAVVKQSQQWH